MQSGAFIAALIDERGMGMPERGAQSNREHDQRPLEHTTNVLILFSSTLDADGDAGEGKMDTPREHLRFAIAFALSRLPKDWLRRLQREHVTDEVARMAAERIVEQIELSNIRYELGPPASAPSTSFGRTP